MIDKKVKLNCPNCDFLLETTIDEDPKFFLLFTCPDCRKNVAYYNKKMDIISDRLLRELVRKNRIVRQGPEQDETVINKEYLTDLKIALETSKSVDDFLLKI